MSDGARPTRVTVDLGAVRHNVGVLKPPGVELMAVVKANAYGHGDVAVARAALEAGATWLGVALVEEGLGLRAAGIEAPILVLSEFAVGSERAALEAGLVPSLYTSEGAERLSAAAGARGRGAPPVGVHVKVDTGMHRVGIWPPEAAAGFVDRVAAEGLEIAGVWTHFARADDDDVTTKEQLALFAEALAQIRAHGHEPRLVHAANSAATISYPEAHLDLVRTGVAIYGIEPATGVGSHLGLRPALTWRSEVSMVKRLSAGEKLSYGHRYELARAATVATVPVGYADGYPRNLSGRADVLIGGRRHRVAGAVTMDQFLVDCGDAPVAARDEVVLIGRQAGEEIGAAELAGCADTIAYEILARIGGRVPRDHEG